MTITIPVLTFSKEVGYFIPRVQSVDWSCSKIEYVWVWVQHSSNKYRVLDNPTEQTLDLGLCIVCPSMCVTSDACLPD